MELSSTVLRPHEYISLKNAMRFLKNAMRFRTHEVVWCLLSAAAIEVAATPQQPSKLEELRAEVGVRVPHMAIGDVVSSRVPGIYEVESLDPPALLYVTADLSYLFAGDLFALAANKRPVNLTEARRERERREVLAASVARDAIVFERSTEISGSGPAAYIFTDVNCGYCRQMHEDIGGITGGGVEVRYLAFPIGGASSSARSYDTMVSVWCASDRRQALTDAKSDKDIPNRTCENTVAEQYELGRRLGVSVTPTIITVGGRLVEGYSGVDDLLSALR